MTKSSTLKHIEEDAARYGFHKVRQGTHPNHKTAWQIKCANCAKEFRAYWGPDTSPALMVRNMRTRHWDVNRGDRPLCPDCTHPRAAAPQPKPETQITVHAPKYPDTTMSRALMAAADQKQRWVPPSVDLPPSILAIDRSLRVSSVKVAKARVTQALSAKTHIESRIAELDEEDRQDRVARVTEKLRRREERRAQKAENRRRAQALAEAVAMAKAAEPKKHDEEPTMIDKKNPPQVAPKIAHEVFIGLDAYFDPQRRLYKNGYDDARVAKECGTTEDIVAYLRTETFGELAEDPRLGQLKLDVAAFERDLETFTRNAGTTLRGLQSRLEQLAQNIRR